MNGPTEVKEQYKEMVPKVFSHLERLVSNKVLLQNKGKEVKAWLTTS